MRNVTAFIALLALAHAHNVRADVERQQFELGHAGLFVTAPAGYAYDGPNRSERDLEILSFEVPQGPAGQHVCGPNLTISRVFQSDIVKSPAEWKMELESYDHRVAGPRVRKLGDLQAMEFVFSSSEVMDVMNAGPNDQGYAVRCLYHQFIVAHRERFHACTLSIAPPDYDQRHVEDLERFCASIRFIDHEQK